MFKACIKQGKFLLMLWCVLLIVQFFVVNRKVYTKVLSDHAKQILQSLPNDNRKLPTENRSLPIGNPWHATSNSDECVAAILYVRIYRGDKPELTTFELEQWVRYLQYAGFDTVYLYDAYDYDYEKLEDWVKNVFSPREVIYHDCNFLTSKDQISAYKHSTENYKNMCKWHFAIDMDEYPFVINDQEKGFLKRFLTNFHKSHPKCSELSFQNFIFSGYPSGKQWLIERIQRRLPGRANLLDKALYIAKYVSLNGAHHNDLAKGKSCDLDGSIARMNHYWGARIQNWSTDTSETLSKTVPDQSILPIVTKLKTISLISNTLTANVTNKYWNVSMHLTD